MQSIWRSPFSLETLNERAAKGLSSHLKIRFTKITPQTLEATMPVDEATIQPMGILHGGASAALAETIGSIAANGCIDLDTHVALGLDLNINHLRSVPLGHELKAVATPFHLGKRTHVWEIKIYDEETLIAISRLTIAVIEKREEKTSSLEKRD